MARLDKFYLHPKSDQMPIDPKVVLSEVGSQTLGPTYAEAAKKIDQTIEVPNVSEWRKELLANLQDSSILILEDLTEVNERLSQDLANHQLYLRKYFITTVAAAIASAQRSFVEVTEYERAILVAPYKVDLDIDSVPQYESMVQSMLFLLADRNILIRSEHVVPNEVAFTKNGILTSLTFDLFDPVLLKQNREWRTSDDLEITEEINEPGIVDVAVRMHAHQAIIQHENGNYFLTLEAERIGVYDKLKKQFIEIEEDDLGEDFL